MTVYDVAFSSFAEDDFTSILRFIAEDSPLRAISFVDELQRRVHDLLSAMPMAGRAIGRHRYVVFGNYVVVYAVDETAARVRVIMVTEGHRHWHRLVKSRT